MNSNQELVLKRTTEYLKKALELHTKLKNKELTNTTYAKKGIERNLKEAIFLLRAWTETQTQAEWLEHTLQSHLYVSNQNRRKLGQTEFLLIGEQIQQAITGISVAFALDEVKPFPVLNMKTVTQIPSLTNIGSEPIKPKVDLAKQPSFLELEAKIKESCPQSGQDVNEAEVLAKAKELELEYEKEELERRAKEKTERENMNGDKE